MTSFDHRSYPKTDHLPGFGVHAVRIMTSTTKNVATVQRWPLLAPAIFIKALFPQMIHYFEESLQTQEFTVNLALC